MQNEIAINPAVEEGMAIAAGDTARPAVTISVTRGVVRLFKQLGYAPLLEFKLPNGRRADVAGVNGKGGMMFAEVKSCQADFDADAKWGEYLEYCDAFYFAVTQDFPMSLLPDDQGLIIADAYGGAVIREAETRPMAAARRKALTLKFARQAAHRALISED